MQLKVYDTVSKIERTVTKKAYDIINRGKKRRYQILETLDDQGNIIEVPQPTEIQTIEKKTEPENPVVAPVVDEPVVELPTEEGVHIIRQPKKRGPKPKVKNA